MTLAATRKYTEKSDIIASCNIVFTVIFLIFSFSFVVLSLDALNYAGLAFSSLICSLSIARLFVIQHDLGHNTFFSRRKFNVYVGRVLSLFTLTPYFAWNYEHLVHHAHQGKLGNEGLSEIWTMTKNQYLGSSKKKILLYKLYRRPEFLFLFAPLFLFLLLYRFPYRFNDRNDKRIRKSVLLTNINLAIFYSFLYFFVGYKLLMLIPIFIFAFSSCIFAFYLQHNFEHTYCEDNGVWNKREAALNGSSVLRFGKIFDFLSINIAYHNVHHLNSGIPSYRLKKCYLEIKSKIPNKEIGFKEAFRAMFLNLWDEENKKLIPFPS